MRRLHRTNEAQLCEQVASVMRSNGWEVYHSVRFGGKELDLCGVRWMGAELQTWAVEAKLNLSLELMEKALIWRPWATFVSVAVGSDVSRYSLVCTALNQHRGLGVLVIDHGVKEPYLPTHVGPLDEWVQVLAHEARKSSAGLIVQGGSRSPIAVRKPERDAEQVAKAMRDDPVPMRALTEMLPGATKVDLDQVARIINARRGRPLGLRARTWGEDYLISAR